MEVNNFNSSENECANLVGFYWMVNDEIQVVIRDVFPPSPVSHCKSIWIIEITEINAKKK
jgi:hypothetical protein